MSGSASDPVKLDHFQNIVAVHWISGIPTYIITTGRFTINYVGVMVASEEGDDAILYPDLPAGFGTLWQVSIAVDFHNEVIPPYSPNERFNSFDIYDQSGTFIETVTALEVAAVLPGIPVTTTFARFECIVDTNATPTDMDWDSVGGDADPLFPDFKTGSALLLFARAFNFSGAEDKYDIFGGGTEWAKARAKDASPSSKSAGDVTVQSGIYLGENYTAIGVKLTEGPGFQPGDYLQAEILLKRN